jgi:uncharacterized protein (DUF433 family)
MEPARTSRRHVDGSGERPVVFGNDIKVSLLASETKHLGMTPDQIAEAHRHLSLADIDAALAYYCGHQHSIRIEWLEARKMVVELRHQYPSRLGDRAP